MIRNRVALVGFLILLFGSARHPFALQAADAPRSLQRILFEPGDNVSGPEGYKTRLSVSPQAGVPRFYGIAIPDQLSNTLHLGEVSVKYADMRVGQILPVFGYVYRVTATGEQAVVLDWIPDKDLPPGLTVQPDALLLPVPRYHPGPLHIHQSSVEVLSLERHPDGRQGKLQANIRVRTRYQNFRGAVHERDVLLIARYGHKVRRIVPPNQGTGAVGWVEFDPNPIPRAQLIADKVAFVQPKAEGPPDDMLRIFFHETAPAESGPFKTWAFRAKSKDGDLLWVGSVFLRGFPWQEDARLGGNVDYPMKTGEIIAMAGYIYRASAAGAILDLIPDKDLPAGLKPLQPDSLALPLCRCELAWARLHDVGIKVLAINVPADAAAGKGTATLQVGPDKEGVRATVRVGDIVLLGTHGHQVRGLVPADKKTGVTGWVELGCQAIPEAQLIRDKVTFVRPAVVTEKSPAP